MPKVNWRRDNTPYMNDPMFTAPLEYENTDLPAPKPDAPPLFEDNRQHADASPGKDFNSGV